MQEHPEEPTRPCDDEALLLTQFALDQAPDAVYWIDEHGRFFYVNEAACRSLDYTREELIQMTVPDIDPTWPVEVWIERWDDMKEAGSSTFETVHRTKQGRIFPVEITTKFIDFRGKTLDCAFARDISERKAAEETLRFTKYAIDNISDMAFWIAPDATIIYANKAATHLLGYSHDELIGMAVYNLNHAFTAETWRDHWADVRQKHTMALQGFVISKSGSRIPVEIRVNYVAFEGKEYHFTFVRDLSELRKAEAENRELEQRLEEHKRRFYREVVLSVTNGKLDICETCDLRPYIVDARLKTHVHEPVDVPSARAEVEVLCRSAGLDGEALGTFMIGVGEAITNALKHGAGGRVYAGAVDHRIWVAVRDKGPGIESLILPRAVLWRGFSTKPSLGLGYTIMLDVADRILLKTGASGTTVVLIRSTEEESMDDLANSWSYPDPNED